MDQPHLTDPPLPRVGQKTINATKGVYIAVAFLFWISLYLYVPTLPTYVQSKTGSLAMVGTILSMYGLWQAVVRLPLGIAVDWLGHRKPFIVTGLVLAGFGAWLLAVADDPAGLLVGRSVTGLAAAAWVPLLVAFSSHFPIDETVRAAALLTFANSTGRVLATSSTGALNNWGGYSLPFFLASGAAGAGFLFILLAREEHRPRKIPSLKGITRLITRREVLLPSLLAAVIQYANWTSTFGFTPILAQRLGASDGTQSIIVTTQLFMTIIGNLTASFFASRVGERRLVIFSFCMLAAGVASTAFATSIAALVAAQLLIGLSHGINYPVLTGLNIRYVGDSERNTALGLHQSVYATGMFAGPWLSGLLAQSIGLRWMLLVTALGTLALGTIGALKLKGIKVSPQ